MMALDFHRNHRLLLALAGFGFFILTLIVAILPALDVREPAPLPGARARTAEEGRGRDLYVKEGCASCHTQYVRDLPVDRPYGRPSLAADYAGEARPLLGSERTGPDLANVGARQPSDVWHLIHLYDPRAVVPKSIMPAYRWYFDVWDQATTEDVVVPVPAGFAPAGKVVVAKPEAIALVRYLQSLRSGSVASMKKKFGVRSGVQEESAKFVSLSKKDDANKEPMASQPEQFSLSLNRGKPFVFNAAARSSAATGIFGRNSPGTPEFMMILCASCEEPIGFIGGVLVALAAVIVLWTVYAAVLYTVRPGEEDPQHVKRRILADEEEELP